MPVVVTAIHIPGTHNNSATGLFSEIGMCCGEKCKWKTHEVLIMRLS